MSKLIIIASLSQEDKNKKVADSYKKLGHIVDYPIWQPDKEFSEIVDDYWINGKSFKQHMQLNKVISGKMTKREAMIFINDRFEEAR